MARVTLIIKIARDLIGCFVVWNSAILRGLEL